MKTQQWAERKACTKCREEKPIAEFGVRRARPDGRSSQCKPCVNSVHRAWASTESGRESQRRRNATESSRESSRRYHASQRGRAKGAKRKRVYRKTPPGRARELATGAISTAISRGKIPPACELPCSEGPDGCSGRHEYHHDSYCADRRMDVRVLCKAHHESWHRNNEPEYPVAAVRAMREAP